MTIFEFVDNRAGGVLELTKSSRSKFKIVCNQFSTVQFLSHQFVFKVRSVQFGTGGTSASVQFLQFSSVSALPAVTRIDLAGSVRLSLGSVHRASSCLGGAEEQF